MKYLRELVGFGCVGGIAMTLHLLVVAMLVPVGSPPLWANVAGFAIAFQWSYHGHRRWTFGAEGSPRRYRRMLMVSLGSFALNECAFAMLLYLGFFDYRLSLLIVLPAVSLATYLASRCWVFGKRISAP